MLLAKGGTGFEEAQTVDGSHTTPAFKNFVIWRRSQVKKEGQHSLISAYVGVSAYDSHAVGVIGRAFHKILGREDGQGLFRGDH